MFRRGTLTYPKTFKKNTKTKTYTYKYEGTCTHHTKQVCGHMILTSVFWTTTCSAFASLILAVPPRKLTWQWKVHRLKMYFLLKMVIFQCNVSFWGVNLRWAAFQRTPTWVNLAAANRVRKLWNVLARSDMQGQQAVLVLQLRCLGLSRPLTPKYLFESGDCHLFLQWNQWNAKKTSNFKVPINYQCASDPFCIGDICVYHVTHLTTFWGTAEIPRPGICFDPKPHKVCHKIETHLVIVEFLHY